LEYSKASYEAAIKTKDQALEKAKFNHQTAENNNQAALKKAAEKQEELQT
jgi:hypothetical protein